MSSSEFMMKILEESAFKNTAFRLTVHIVFKDASLKIDSSPVADSTDWS